METVDPSMERDCALAAIDGNLSGIFGFASFLGLVQAAKLLAMVVGKPLHYNLLFEALITHQLH